MTQSSPSEWLKILAANVLHDEETALWQGMSITPIKLAAALVMQRL